ncbi:MAG TPA: AAA family ATPase [Bauldia sp.]
MRVANVTIKNFRGVSSSTLQFGKHVALIGDNNSGKSTVIEAIDLVLGPDRLSRSAPIDEHDFYAGQYLAADGVTQVPIEIEVLIVDLSHEQLRHFRNNLEFWDEASSKLVEGPLDAIAKPTVKEALRVGFRGWYEAEDDDFKAETFFCFPAREDGQRSAFRAPDKRRCGFLLLRTLRTGARALSLERGSLLDIILRVRELRPKMWEKVLAELRVLPVAEDPGIGVSAVLSGIQAAIKDFVPLDWAADPHLRVSDLTREHLRKTLTVFMATGATVAGKPHAAPFQHQGTGTINMLVLALLSTIADAKKTVIFAMEEPEIAIPPATQKRIVHGVRSKSSQSFFTSHSPYVLEEFVPEEILVLTRTAAGVLTGQPVVFPAAVKPKFYSQEFRLRFAEALLAKRVLIAEGDTEALAYPAAGRRLSELAETPIPRWRLLASRSSMPAAIPKSPCMARSFAPWARPLLRSTTSSQTRPRRQRSRQRLTILLSRRRKGSRTCFSPRPTSPRSSVWHRTGHRRRMAAPSGLRHPCRCDATSRPTRRAQAVFQLGQGEGRGRRHGGAMLCGRGVADLEDDLGSDQVDRPSRRRHSACCRRPGCRWRCAGDDNVYRVAGRP